MDQNQKRAQKESGGEIALSENRAIRFLDNVWYHYKWHIIVIAFFAIVLTVCFVQCAKKPKSDLKVTYAGICNWTDDERNGIVDVLSAVLPEDSDGNGEKRISLVTYSISSEEDLKALFTDEDGALLSTYYTALKGNQDEITAFSGFQMTGDSAIFFVSPYVYESLINREAYRTMTDVFGTLPASAFDENAIRLSETALYRYYDALHVLPEDTLILLAQKHLFGETSGEREYALAENTFRALVTFEIP